MWLIRRGVQNKHMERAPDWVNYCPIQFQIQSEISKDQFEPWNTYLSGLPFSISPGLLSVGWHYYPCSRRVPPVGPPFRASQWPLRGPWFVPRRNRPL